MKTLLFILLLFIPTLLFADTTVEPRFPDLTPGDGFFDAGTRQNPWVIKKAPWVFD